MSAEAEILRARLRKARAIAAVLEGVGALPCEVSGIDETGRRAAEALAGVNLSSDATWAMVADVLSARLALRDRLSALPADPFDVFTA